VQGSEDVDLDKTRHDLLAQEPHGALLEVMMVERLRKV